MEKKKIYLATGNKNKKREVQNILPDYEVLIPADENIDFNPIENGTTFYENSLIKARTLYEIVHCPVIADDSGISVDVLNGIPGIYSARYAGAEFPQGKPNGEKISQEEQNINLIEQTNEAIAKGNFPKKEYLNGERSCHYTCAMVLYCGPDRLFVAQDTFEGQLISDIKDQAGTGGFGYDPIVYLPEYKCTIAQLTSEEKDAISHRGKATRILKKIIENL